MRIQSTSAQILSPPGPRRSLRRGVAATLAMLYLAMFSALAVGFYAAFTLATQVSYNEQDARRALATAESGMEFIRHELWALDIEHDTLPDELFDKVYAQLSAAMNGTDNLKGGSIALVGNEILIPGDPDGYINLNGSGDGFQIRIQRDGKELIVSAAGRTAVGSAASMDRQIRLRYGIFEKPSSIFDFGVASKSAITMTGNTQIVGSPDPSNGSVLSTASAAYPLIMGSNCAISGEVSFSNPGAWVKSGTNSVINNEVGEKNWSDNVHHVEAPDFPVVDTSDYAIYATNTIASSNPMGTQFINIRIPANTNPTFAAGTEIFGVMYIEGPNHVKFAGSTAIHGIIVTENDAAGDWATTNKIEFRGTVKADGVENLPANDPRFTGLREMGGAFILAENFSVDFGGNATAGATGVTGSIVASNVSFSGSADAVIEGGVINLEPTSSVYFSGNSDVVIKSTGTKTQPHGLYFGSRYVPLPGSYEEVLP